MEKRVANKSSKAVLPPLHLMPCQPLPIGPGIFRLVGLKAIYALWLLLHPRIVENWLDRSSYGNLVADDFWTRRDLVGPIQLRQFNLLISASSWTVRDHAWTGPFMIFLVFCLSLIGTISGPTLLFSLLFLSLPTIFMLFFALQND